MTEPRKPFPFTRILKAFVAGAGWLWGISEHNRANRLEKDLLEYKPPHQLPPCWAERIEAEDPQPKHRE